MKKVLKLIPFLILLNACNNTNVKPMLPPPMMADEDTTSAGSVGTICYQREKNLLKVAYYAHDSACISSSTFDNRYSMNLYKKENSINIEVKGYFKKKHSEVALADCAGAGVFFKKIEISPDISVIKWNNLKVANIPSDNQTHCYKRNGTYIFKDNKLKKDFEAMF